MLELATRKSKERGSALADNKRDRITGKQQKVNTPEGVGLSGKRSRALSTLSSKKQKLDVMRNSRENLKLSTNDDGGSSEDGSYGGTEAEAANLMSGHADYEITKKGKPTAKRENTLTLDADSRRR